VRAAIPILMLSLNAHAMDAGFSVGQSFQGIADNGIWYQKGFPYAMDLKSGAYRAYIGGKPFKEIRISWLDWLRDARVEGDYSNYGSSNGSTTYVSDENYTGNEDRPCYDPCEAPRSAVWEGKSHALGLSVMPEIRFSKLLIQPRIGGQIFQAKTIVIAQNHARVYQDARIPDPNPSIGRYDESKTGFSWYYGIGVEYKGFKLEYTRSPIIKAGNDSIQRGVQFLGINFQRSF